LRTRNWILINQQRQENQTHDQRKHQIELSNKNKKLSVKKTKDDENVE